MIASRLFSSALCTALAVCGAAAAQTPAPPAPSTAAIPKAPLFGYSRAVTLPGYYNVQAGKKKILLIGDTHTGNVSAHDSVSHALAVLERSLYKAGYAVYVKTDSLWLTKAEVWGAGDYAKGGKKAARGRNLNDFAAVVFYTNGDTEMSPAQKADLLSWLKDDGKGLVGIHTAATTMLNYPAYADMLGSKFDNHPWGVVDAKVIVERQDFPGMTGFVVNPVVRDEHYQQTDPYSRTGVDVLMRIDPKSVKMDSPNIHRTDGDLAVAWIKNYGKGRVFYSSLGHADSMWDDARVQDMYVNAVRWAAGDLTYPVRPHAMPETCVACSITP